ncbi:SGNH/GDSL hydrolase family protein [Fulvivirgaceae bacterium BMA12]|uniref:SGNH/GDSL hydrolase family protein n=1 Tax=Agaribacillus aureus TaxID=3051825 RepID=A0ABT8LJI4_9BACT|nr:SGNH/GDSL hydrolase family protein [Fulvivirgaceae bacterium BMA12]
MKKNRRTFLRNSALASLAMTAAPAAANSFSNSNPSIPDGLTILFQGDSITDAGRARDQYYANSTRGLGIGYAYLATSQLLANNPNGNFSIYNRGVSGNKVYQLADRWKDDALNLRPNVLSILIGVNDFWHMVNGHYDGTVERYESDYRDLLNRTVKEVPGVKLIICEPFVAWGGSAITERWKAEFPAYQKSAAKIAEAFKASFVPFQKVFDEALKKAPAKVWCPDGVHPSPAGAHLMAQAWLETFNKLY